MPDVDTWIRLEPCHVVRSAFTIARSCVRFHRGRSFELRGQGSVSAGLLDTEARHGQRGTSLTSQLLGPTDIKEAKEGRDEFDKFTISVQSR